ncbi:hypothetical protein GCM10009837_64250 [Streptomyces durmitorensis]|uniref:Uncharacterized protein n=1 Tax=Streptomyces durmitorensis TaxID=319947 RepID=A0ABY4PV99_9ACTN|nr:hypothetical protein [Streptomyces durmitorensis]UQT57025.1 hypothetical protein M4V62_19020 [Streptomyces durmitorensis]
MDTWQPEPGETLLTRAYVTFATGEATRVRGMRWFRDTERRDIQSELPGWPEGPVYQARSTGGSVARNVGKGGLIALGGAIMAVLSSAGGNVSGGSGPGSGSGTPDEPADEIEDFPVLWAASGSVARTLPWQLDPARSPEKHYRTHAIVTDRRLVIVGFPHSKKNDRLIEDEVLWEVPRSRISRVEPKPFKDGTDVKVIFSDDSWCRLHAVTQEKFTRYLRHPLELIPLDDLTPAQRTTVEAFVAASPASSDAGAPVVSRLPCGHYQISFIRSYEVDSFFGLSENDMTMDAEGAEVECEDRHPDDF